MEEIKSEEMYMEDLDGWILEENKVSNPYISNDHSKGHFWEVSILLFQVVTYKYLSRALDVHVNTAKQMLWRYKESKQGACKGVVYFVSGLVSKHLIYRM